VLTVKSALTAVACVVGIGAGAVLFGLALGLLAILAGTSGGPALVELGEWLRAD
jgi:hypothetical protein